MWQQSGDAPFWRGHLPHVLNASKVGGGEQATTARDNTHIRGNNRVREKMGTTEVRATEPWFCESHEHVMNWMHWNGYDMQMCANCAYGYLTGTITPIPTCWWEKQQCWIPSLAKIATTLPRNTERGFGRPTR